MNNPTPVASVAPGSPANPLPSATVLMLRDGKDGLEVFMLKRHGLSDVLGGAYVFPGGKVDDRDDAYLDRLDRPARDLHASLGEAELTERQAARLYVAAIREVFEEAGVLFGISANGSPPSAPASGLRGDHFDVVLGRAATRLHTVPLVPWYRWVTPQASVRARKHFDARFFVATVPEGQEPMHDQHEAVESMWIAPRVALHAYWDGRLQLPAPQIMSLSQLAQLRSVSDVLTQARSRKPPRVQPEAFVEDGIQMICYPGDDRHSVRERALSGPTRLCWRNERHEPDGGIKALLG